MIRLYTAVGTLKLNSHGLPTLVSIDREYGLTALELVLWSCLSFRILTYDEFRSGGGGNSQDALRAVR